MRVLVSGGGTGGHIYPAVSLVKHLREQHPTAEFLYVGTERGLESKIVPEANIPFKTIEIQGFRRSLSLENFKTVYLFLKSVRDSKKIIKEFKPDVVLGTGGYVSAAVVYSAHKQGVPTVIHEQNSVPGVTNKFLAKYVDKIAICFPEAAEYFPSQKVEITGNPRAQEVATVEKSDILKTYGLDPVKTTALIFGGSQGALKLSSAMKDSLAELASRDYQILFATGERYYEEIANELKTNFSDCQNIALQPYISNMEDVLKNVDLVVSRAGATTIAELTALGLPSILIPSPNVTNDHQTKNAMSLVNVGAASLLKDCDLDGTHLVAALDNILLDKASLAVMSEASRQQGIPDATDRLLTVVSTIMS
ncbi:undecaprenyldiphospho-muramoylpentapeptide beta-N-acetylglucosaminyltransferase [Vagococcus intermedius]|uniref:UDP-N-acetylglucosamine--N-acetylmuramyl-(pentapeptide) pyrophosphoryl-undecaprenol N-acetylglucosamine transferase n=1 Tax=Vagococcus intermedius TaxID=2991418 RepID=A0AAF0CWI0_9ENTE|nr:undecaprenyldiphospho-muramoylpentapeptide beta-N-acetylglucosaminyltransferase [Vagococcus intermedius]WEG74300.1 undecaprenyldiphospho-muramoylpentapeptide beta-N-acetylglucosaminyltransferase [Vagococcus intermedius]WEG76381.1 undecaprenyldiphospho-muramoylpentapeptide beta-N-acetylglucosaminyltransferase [Vagococcus intermedius]